MGTACDWNKKDQNFLSGLKSRGFHTIKELIHGGEGGGLHEYTTDYSRSSGNALAGKLSVKEAAGELPAGARSPASNGALERFPNGKYKCPTNLRSICGSTIGTPWCKYWTHHGHTPGCYN
jgi:hypothetical protein